MASISTLFFAAILGSAALIVPASAQPLDADPKQWLDEILYPKPGNGTAYDEIQCYSLPYGGYGFLSHVLSYYTATCLIYGRKPLWPWSLLEHSIFDTCLCLLSMVITVTLSGFTMNSCRNSWPFLLVATWKLSLSFTLNLVGLLSSLAARRRQTSGNKYEPARPFAATVVYWLGTVVGLVGVFDIVHQTFATNRNVQIVTGILIALVGIVLLLGLIATALIYLEDYDTSDLFGGVAISPAIAAAVAIAVAVFYSDWALAAVQANWAGTPSGDQMYLYWIYFGAKRLPLFSL